MADGPKEKYELSLKGPGVSINKAIDQRIALAIVQIALGNEEVAKSEIQRTVVGHAATAIGQRAQPLSLREYLQQTAANSSIHGKIAAVGRYMRDVESQSDFARDDIRGRFRAAGEPPPANFHRDFQKAVRVGWIAEDHQNHGRFYVTRTGDEAMERRFSPTVSSKARTKHNRGEPQRTDN